jgi:hypothetical protein
MTGAARTLIASIVVLGAAASLGAQVRITDPVSACPVTAPDMAFVPPDPYPPAAPRGSFWYGNAGLWTMLQNEGRWSGLWRNEDGFRQKVFWWHPGFDGRVEQRPALRVVARRLDRDAPLYEVVGATNAHNDGFGGNGWTMLTGVDVPSEGCWEFMAEYRGHALSFVVAVGP